MPRILLHVQVGDRMHGVRPADRRRVDLGEAEVPHASGVDHLLDRADRLLDRHGGVRPRRAVAGRRPDDPAVGGLVGRLRAEHEVAVRRADRKTMVHPRAGRMLMDCETLVTLDQRQMPAVLTPANTEARERLDLLHILGTQDFPTATLENPAR